MNQDPRDELVRAITAALGVTPPSLNQKSPGSDLYELYILTLVIEATENLNGHVSYEDVHGAVPQTFIARTSPGYIYSTQQAYCHAVLSFPQTPRVPVLEAHIGIRVAGASGVLHECDVAVLPKAEANTCRANRVQPRHSALVLAAECKFYADALPLGMARAFIGLTADLSRDSRYFVFNLTEQTLEQYLAARARHWGRSVTPGSPRDEGRLRSAFETTLRDYIAGTR